MMHLHTILALGFACLLRTTQALWPAPSQYTSGNQTIRLHSTFSIIPPTNTDFPDDLEAAMNTAAKYLSSDKLAPLVVNLDEVEEAARNSRNTLYFLQLNVQASSAENKTQQRRRNASAKQKSLKKRQLQSIASEINLPFDERDESYTLQISLTNSVAHLNASTSLGFLRGLQTFTQLVYTTQSDKIQYIRDAPYSITDKAAHPVRGHLLDTARNYYPVKDIKRTLDAMSWAKMNYFHWHITDSQSWPLVIPSLPELSAKAAYSPSMVYTLDTVKEVVQYANAIGIQVVLEIDTPGHTASIAASYPDLVACVDGDWTIVAAEPNPGQLKPTEEKAIKLVQTVYSEVIKYLPGTLFSTGGDEINLKCYENDTSVQAALTSHNQTILQAIGNFINQTHETVYAAGKVPVIWEDTAIGAEAVPMRPDVIVTAWRGAETLPQILQAGYRTIQVDYNSHYLDCGMGGWVGPGSSWCSYVSWWTTYDSYSSFQNYTSTEQSLILGGMGALWSEQAGPSVVDSLLWPRLAAVGEIYWLGEQGINNEGLNSTEALGRLHDLRYRMVQRGIAAKPLQPHWCALRPELCLA